MGEIQHQDFSEQRRAAYDGSRALINLLQMWNKPEQIADDIAAHLAPSGITFQNFLKAISDEDGSAKATRVFSERLQRDRVLLGGFANVEHDITGNDYFSDPQEMVENAIVALENNPNIRELVRLVQEDRNFDDTVLHELLKDQQVRLVLSAIESSYRNLSNVQNQVRPNLFELFSSAGMEARPIRIR